MEGRMTMQEVGVKVDLQTGTGTANAALVRALRSLLMTKVLRDRKMTEQDGLRSITPLYFIG
jgi:hypothetical protein